MTNFNKKSKQKNGIFWYFLYYTKVQGRLCDCLYVNIDLVNISTYRSTTSWKLYSIVLGQVLAYLVGVIA